MVNAEITAERERGAIDRTKRKTSHDRVARRQLTGNAGNGDRSTTKMRVLIVPFLVSFAIVVLEVARVAAGSGWGQTAWAQGRSGFVRSDFVRSVRAIETGRQGHPSQAGLAFSSSADAFLVLETPEATPSRYSNIIVFSHAGDIAGSVRIAAGLRDPINMAFDDTANRLLMFEPGPGELIEIAAGSDGTLAPGTLTRIDAWHFGLQDPQGMSVDPLSGDLFILDGNGPRIVRVEPDPVLGFEHAAVSEVSLDGSGLEEVRGIAFDPTTGHFQILRPDRQRLYEVTDVALVVVNRDVSGFGLRDPQAMVFAPSGDLTDDPSAMSLYIADGGTGGNVKKGGMGGGITELSLTATR